MWPKNSDSTSQPDYTSGADNIPMDDGSINFGPHVNAFDCNSVPEVDSTLRVIAKEFVPHSQYLNSERCSVTDLAEKIPDLDTQTTPFSDMLDARNADENGTELAETDVNSYVEVSMLTPVDDANGEEIYVIPEPSGEGDSLPSHSIRGASEGDICVSSHDVQSSSLSPSENDLKQAPADDLAVADNSSGESGDSGGNVTNADDHDEPHEPEIVGTTSGEITEEDVNRCTDLSQPELSVPDATLSSDTPAAQVAAKVESESREENQGYISEFPPIQSTKTPSEVHF